MSSQTFSECLLCLEEMTLGVLSVINCGHVYHYECIQRMYKNDRESGKKSKCPACRNAIISVPNKIFGTFSMEKVSYALGEEIAPNINGLRRVYTERDADTNNNLNNSTNAPTNTILLEQLEFYEGRLADLEAQLEDFESIEDENEELRMELEEKTGELEEAKRRLDDRDRDFMKLIKNKNRLQEQMDATVKSLNLQIDALKTELESTVFELEAYQDAKLSLETQRLATEITKLQSETYFKNLLRSRSSEEIVGLLAGMHVKFAESEREKTELEKEIRKLNIMLEKEQRRKQYGLNNSAMSYIKPIDTRGISSGISRSNADTIEIKSIADTRFNNTDTRYNNTDTTTIDLENNTPLPSPTLLPALLMKRSPPPPNALNVSKLVPSVRPAGLDVPRGGAITGTGKRAKIMEMPDGTKRAI